jgi:hypothetical protein
MKFLKVQYLVFCFSSYIYISDLPPTITFQSKPILFIDDTSIITYHPESEYFRNSINDVFASFYFDKLYEAKEVHIQHLNVTV